MLWLDFEFSFLLQSPFHSRGGNCPPRLKGEVSVLPPVVHCVASTKDVCLDCRFWVCVWFKKKKKMFTLGVFSDVQLDVDDCVTTACFDYRNHCRCAISPPSADCKVFLFVFLHFTLRFVSPTESPLLPSGLLSYSLTFRQWCTAPSTSASRFYFFIFFSYVRRMSHRRFLSLLLHLQICLFKHLPLVP